ncbi:MAG TPA: hypothetical protein DHV26_12940 [Cytophagales bacterium]|nr:hypothetical protein [Cytophagales bacterium]
MPCVSNKRIYYSIAQAEDALISAYILFDYRKGTGPIAFYKCDDCGNYHLTSRGTMNARLAEAIANGTIQKQKTAASWHKKFKK